MVGLLFYKELRDRGPAGARVAELGAGSERQLGMCGTRRVGGKIRSWLRAAAKGGRRNTDGAICDGSGS